MRRFKAPLVVVVGVVVLVFAAAAAASAGDPVESERSFAGVLDRVGDVDSSTAAEQPPNAVNFELVGHIDPEGSQHADVYAHGNFAYLGFLARGLDCPPGGVKAIDISNPAQPRVASVLQAPPDTGAEDVVVQRVSTPTFTGDLAVLGIQPCRRLSSAFRGLQFYDVTNPYHPRELGRWEFGHFTIGCHEVDLVQRPDGRVLAGCASSSAEAPPLGGLPEAIIVDATNPAAPQQIGSFGLFRDLGIFPPDEGVGCFGAAFAHSVRFVNEGRRLYVSYWDAGVIVLDLANPANPSLVTRTRIAPPDEDGDVHSVSFARSGQLLLVSLEDFSPIDEEEEFCDEPGDYGGWGELQIYDNRNPANPTFITEFDTANSAAKRTDGIYTIHNTEVVGEDQVFASWYSDGIRWLDLSNPAQPVERGSFVPPPSVDPEGEEAPPLVWGVWPHRGLILASDILSGLWILRPGERFEIPLSGTEEVPVRATSASGHASFRLSLDGQSLEYSLEVRNITNVVAAHIHIGARGENGPVVLFLYGPAAPGGGPIGGHIGNGTGTAADLVGPLAGRPFAELVAALRSGNAYVNVHTDNGVPPADTGPGDFPGGEIRGQFASR